MSEKENHLSLVETSEHPDQLRLLIAKRLVRLEDYAAFSAVVLAIIKKHAFIDMPEIYPPDYLPARAQSYVDHLIEEVWQVMKEGE